MPTAELTTPGFPRSPDFMGSVEESELSPLTSGAKQPFGMSFLSPVTGTLERMDGLRYDAQRQQAVTDTGLLPRMGGRPTSKGTSKFFECWVDGFYLLDQGYDVVCD